MVNYRREKVAAQLMRELSDLIYDKLSEEYKLVAITDIDVTADFKEALVYISFGDANKEKEVLDRLNSQAPDYHKLLEKKLKMKFVPYLKFKIDRNLEKIQHIEKLLQEIKNES